MVECCEWWIWWCVHAQTHTSNAEPVMYENQISFIQLFENTQMLYINGARHGLICTCRDTEKVYWHKLKCNLKFCIFISKHPNYYSGRKACYAVRTHTHSDWTHIIHRQHHDRTVNDAFIQQLKTANILHSQTHYTPSVSVSFDLVRETVPKTTRTFLRVIHCKAFTFLMANGVCDGATNDRFCQAKKKKKNVHATPLHWFSLLWRRMCAPPQRYARCESLLNVHLAHSIHIGTH